MNRKFNKEQIISDITDILKNKLKVDENAIFPESSFHIEMEMDSLEIAEIFFYTEDHFTITFLSTDEEKINNFQQLVDMTEKYLIKHDSYIY